MLTKAGPRTATDFKTVAGRLEQVGQGHVLRFYPELEPARQRSLLEQAAALDLEALPGLIDRYVKNKPRFELPADLRPAPYVRRDPGPEERGARQRQREYGEQLLRAGKIGAVVVAGGQGSRLGFEGPKGCFPAGAVSGKSLFQMFAETILAAAERYGVSIPWYIMTSPLNHESTVKFFGGHEYFGLQPQDVMFFPQGVMPSLDINTGRILMTSKSEIATNPDGHGGSIRALDASVALADLRRRGIEHVSYFQVDNPIVKVLDPLFIGLHAGPGEGKEASSGEMSSKMIPKAYPGEKLGVFCSAGGRTEIIEYSDLPRGLAEERLADGSLRFLAGSIAVHMMGVGFIDRLNNDPAFGLPYHRAEKQVACIDPDTGEPIVPKANNAVKLERFVFDALPMCKDSVVLETERVEEFAPIKNATGADSAESCREIQTERAARWLRAAGVEVPTRTDGKADCVLEISPFTALDAGDLRGGQLPGVIPRGASMIL
jgi:UDP-N-acetylglucosamine/UDP-N-acetylgalactosamine diphosphorylase